MRFWHTIKKGAWDKKAASYTDTYHDDVDCSSNDDDDIEPREISMYIVPVSMQQVVFRRLVASLHVHNDSKKL